MRGLKLISTTVGLALLQGCGDGGVDIFAAAGLERPDRCARTSTPTAEPTCGS